ncbi:MAG: PLP-dependent transferase, partial [Hyphomicrobiaceae bacterium]|nr:PLP-dependent transferase [Hyphomicrobiaceae bacterium]
MSKSKKAGTKSDTEHGIETTLMHLGRSPGEYYGFVNPPLYRGSTILYPTVEKLKSKNQKFTYGRRGSPTVRGLEDA